MYYDPKYDSQSNFPAAKTRVERLHIREGRLTHEQMSSRTVGVSFQWLKI